MNHIFLFQNTIHYMFSEEIKISNEIAQEEQYGGLPGPYVQGTEGFKSLMSSGKKLSFVLTKKNGIVIGKHINHSILAGGEKIITGGSIFQDKNNHNVYILDNKTGHYQTSVSSLSKSVPFFNSLGYRISKAIKSQKIDERFSPPQDEKSEIKEIFFENQ